MYNISLSYSSVSHLFFFDPFAALLTLGDKKKLPRQINEERIPTSFVAVSTGLRRDCAAVQYHTVSNRRRHFICITHTHSYAHTHKTVLQSIHDFSFATRKFSPQRSTTQHALFPRRTWARTDGLATRRDLHITGPYSRRRPASTPFTC